MADLEEGEIVDSDTEESSTLKCDTKPADNGETGNKCSSISLPPRSSFSFVDLAQKQPLSTFTQMRQTGYRSDRNRGASSGDDSSNSSDEDTDLWKCKKAKYFSKSKEQCMELTNEICSPPRPLRTASSQKGIEDDSGEEASPAKKKKKVNNIWGSVLTEQTLTQSLTGVGVDKSEELLTSDRNVEKYDFTKAYEDTRPRVAYEMDNSRPSNDPFENVIDTLDDADDNAWKVRVGQKRRRPVKERLGMEFDHEDVKPMLQLDATEEDSENKVVNAILKSLDEPNVELFTSIVKVIGKKQALELVHKTESVEEAGGLLTYDGERRRTRGGVYIQLLKKEITKEQNKVIFAADQLKYKQQLKQRKKAKRKRAKELQRMLPQSRYHNSKTTGSTPSKDHMDIEHSADDQKCLDSEEDDKGDNSMELRTVGPCELNGSKTDIDCVTINQSNTLNISENSDDFLDIEIGENDAID